MKNFAPHFFVGDAGDLFDLRRERFPTTPIRSKVSCHYRAITDTKRLRATLRAGTHTHVGGYRLAFVCHDGELLSFNAVRENYRLVSEAIRDTDKSGWLVVGIVTLDHMDYETDQHCAHTGELLWSVED